MATAWYLCNYTHAKRAGIWVRTAAMNQQSATIKADGGYWEETEIDGDKALCHVRGTTTLLNTLQGIFMRLTDNEATATWTPTRAVPEYNQAQDRIRFRENERVPCKPLQNVADRVREHEGGSAELAMLVSLWLSLGFGLGWRLPYQIACWAACHIGEPTAFWRELLQFTFGSGGGFPFNTTILDNFNRADESPAAGWATVQSGKDLIRVVSNQAAKITTGSGDAAAVLSAYTFGGGVETYFDAPTSPGAGSYYVVYHRISDLAGTGDGYYFYSAVTGGAASAAIARLDNGTGTDLGGTFDSPGWSSGDSIGIDHSAGGIATAYRKPSAGSWTQLTNRSDNTYVDYGCGGVGGGGTTFRYENFGGGTMAYVIPSYRLFPKPKMRMPIIAGRVA